MAGLIYGAIVVGFVALIMAGSEAGLGEAMSVLTRILLGLQMAMLGVMGSLTTANAIEKDNSSKMMDSHRLMPIDGRLAVLGYPAGSLSPYAFVALTNFVIGGMATGIAGLPIYWWLYANAVGVSFCVFVAVILAGLAMCSKLLILVAAPLVLVGLAVGGVVPGAGLLASPALGRSIFAAFEADSETLMLGLISLALQVLIAWVVTLAGARRFRNPDLPGFTGMLGLALAAIFAVASAIGINADSVVGRRYVSDRHTDRLMVTLICILAIGFVAISGHVAQHLGELRGRYRGMRLALRDGMIVCGLLACALGFGLLAPRIDHLAERLAWATAEMAIALVMILLWARLLYSRGYTPKMLIGAAMGVCMLPPFVGMLLTMRSTEPDAVAQTITQLSPMAMLSAISLDLATFRPGALVGQTILAAVAGVFLWRGCRNGLNPMLRGR